MSTEARSTLALVLAVIAFVISQVQLGQYLRKRLRARRARRTTRDLWLAAPRNSILTSDGYAVNPRMENGRCVVDAHRPGHADPVKMVVQEFDEERKR